MAKKARTEISDVVDALADEHDELLRVSLVYNNRRYSPELAEELKIDQNDLDNEFSEQPKKYGWWATLHALSQEKVDQLEQALVVTEAEIDHKFRSEGSITEYDEEGGETNIKLTEDGMKRAISRNTDVKALKGQIIDAKKNAAVLKGAKDSFDQRKDMLIQLGASSRKEYANPELRSLKEKAKDAIKNGKN